MVVAALAPVLGLWWVVQLGPLRDPREALNDFYEAKDRAEDQLIDPLILAGSRVVPVVMAELPNKEMRLRRYGIGFLGNGRYLQALPALEAVLGDATEVHTLRADALSAIYRISPARAQQLAPQHVGGEELLGKVAQDIVAGRGPAYFERSYWDALWHVHH